MGQSLKTVPRASDGNQTDLLLRSEAVEDYCDYCKDDVREPEGKGWRECVRIDEHLTELHEKDVGEGQGNAGSNVPSDTSPSLL